MPAAPACSPREVRPHAAAGRAERLYATERAEGDGGGLAAGGKFEWARRRLLDEVALLALAQEAGGERAADSGGGGGDGGEDGGGGDAVDGVGDALCQPTNSVYSWPTDWLWFNLGRHVEHHDFPEVPWSRLHLVTAAAPEFYASLRSFAGVGDVLARYLERHESWAYGCQGAYGFLR